MEFATQIMQMAVMAAFLIGILAFVVSVITQVIKAWPGLEQLPTACVVIVLSIIICPVAYAFAMWTLKRPIEWPFLAACVVAGFFVALVAMDGWERIKEILDRTKYPGEIPTGKNNK